MEYKDYYKVLGVSRDATPDVIKRAYRKLARKYHPDVSKEANAEEHFKEVQEAYEVLKDEKKRASYDQLGSQWKSGQEFRTPPGWQGFGDGSGSFYTEDISGAGGGNFSDFFEAIFGRTAQSGHHRARPVRAQRGRDEHAKIRITLNEAFQGGSQTIYFKVPELDAKGQLNEVTRTLKITIPPGIISGQQLRLSHQGGKGKNGGPNGDLFLEIDIEPHPYFTLQARNVYLTLPITPWEAALGAKIKVPTLGGAVDLKITPGSQAGQTLRLKGRGLPGKPDAGDQYILLQILTPPAKTDTARHLYEQMAKELPFDPRVHLTSL